MMAERWLAIFKRMNPKIEYNVLPTKESIVIEVRQNPNSRQKVRGRKPKIEVIPLSKGWRRHDFEQENFELRFKTKERFSTKNLYFNDPIISEKDTIAKNLPKVLKPNTNNENQNLIMKISQNYGESETRELLLMCENILNHRASTLKGI